MTKAAFLSRNVSRGMHQTRTPADHLAFLLQHYLAAREQWFILSQEQVVKLAKLAHTILGLEASR